MGPRGEWRSFFTGDDLRPVGEWARHRSRGRSRRAGLREYRDRDGSDSSRILVFGLGLDTIGYRLCWHIWTLSILAVAGSNRELDGSGISRGTGWISSHTYNWNRGHPCARMMAERCPALPSDFRKQKSRTPGCSKTRVLKDLMVERGPMRNNSSQPLIHAWQTSDLTQFYG